ncbi:ergothioneine biosynthesis protein EgtC [Nocardia miyunensis]|uniref:ergothioneine biosynthesis protein EgtC n=1 Tax=Nocardia miyunensis TaxID=282684 RepID=UPI00082C661C|nr:ergothioneine biosynthesis protein EgtC [Nocardia miyunensis]
MCRHLGYLGPVAPVGEILTRGAHSLYTQAWAPHDMRGGGTINADGFGVAWWLPGGGVSRYRNSSAIWTDPAVEEVLPQLHSSAVLGAVRSATNSLSVERNACAPFTGGQWAFSHNGRIPDWQPVLTRLATEFGSPSLIGAESRTDAATLWVIVRDLLEKSGDADSSVADPAAVLPRVIRAVLDLSPESRLNLLLGDGETLWATTVHHALSVLVTDEIAVVSSEPYDDDPRWRAVPDRQLVTLRPGHLSIVPLHTEDSERALR